MPTSPTDDPLRIALLSHRFPVVSETFVIRLAADLSEAGHDLRVLAADHRAEPSGKVHELVERAGLEARTHRAEEAGRIGPRALLARATPRAAVTLALAELVSPKRLAVTRLMASQPPLDVVHAQFGPLGLLALRHRRYGTLRTRALVVHLRGYDITRFVHENGERVYAGLFEGAELFMANSDHFRRTAIELGCPPDKVVVVGSPIDTDRFAPPDRRDPYPGRPLRLVAVGRLVEKKGFAHAIDAVALLREGGREVVLDIIGEGPLREDLARRAGPGVRLVGAASSDEVRAALHRADIAIAPSVTASDGDQDGPVNTLKEAMATGLPVVGTRHGGIPELVGRSNGILVPEGDATALAKGIVDLMDEPGVWSEMGAAGRRKVVSSFGRGHILGQTVSAYREVLARSGDN